MTLRRQQASKTSAGYSCGMHKITDPAPGDPALTDLFALPADTLYLDTAAHGPRLRAVQDAAQAALDAGVAPWRVSASDWEASIERVRARAAAVFDGDGGGKGDGDSDAVALVPSAAYGLAIAARNLPLAAGDAVLVLDGQFPSNLLPWQQRCSEVGARMVAVRRVPDQGWTGAVLAALDADPAIRVLALPHVHWHDGALLDLDRIAARARDSGAALVLDLSQSLGALPAAIARWQPAFAVAVGHKWLLGAHGLAYLWAAPHWRDHGVSIEQHWLARDGGDAWHFPADRAAPYRAGARRYDAGGVADPLRLAMADAALRQVNDWGVARIAAALRTRTAAFEAGLRECGLSHWATPGPVAHFLGVRPLRADVLAAVAAALGAAGVVVTTRHGLLRIAPYLQVGVDDLRRVAAIIGAVANAVPGRG